MALFITLEGLDGSGKTTQVQRLVARLKAEGHQVTHVREPGGTPLGERLREILHDKAYGLSAPRGQRMTIHSEAFLYASARAELVQHVVTPALAAQHIVISDRYVESSLAYQSFGGGLPLEFVASLNEMATGGLRPHRTILIDVPPAVGLARVAQARGEADRMEEKDTSFHEQVREGYLSLAAEEPRRWRVINGTRSIDEVADAVWQSVKDLLPRRLGNR